MVINNEEYTPGHYAVFVFQGDWKIGKILPTPEYDIKRNIIRVSTSETDYVNRNVEYVKKLTMEEMVEYILGQ